jgi:hypothetical protein
MVRKPPKDEKYGITNIESLTPGAPADPAEVNNSDQLTQDDTATVLARDTQTGKGVDPIPESDFVSFATEGVEDDGSEALFEQTVEEVLAGKWGNAQDRRLALRDAGHNVTDVQLEVNRRLAAGTPSGAPRDSTVDIARQVIWGEWGVSEDEVRRNLEGAGLVPSVIEAEVRKQLGN